MQEEALADIAAGPDAAGTFTLCLFRAEWHQGVVGIVASRLKDKYHRPAIVFARGSGDELKGSGRSIAGFHLRDALDLVAKRAPGVVARFGGHAYAAGLSIAEADLTHFAATFEAVAREQLSPAELARIRESDGVLALELRSSRRGSRGKCGARAFRRLHGTTCSKSPTSGLSAGVTRSSCCGDRGRALKPGMQRCSSTMPIPCLRRSARSTVPIRTRGTGRSRCSSSSSIGSRRTTTGAPPPIGHLESDRRPRVAFGILFLHLGNAPTPLPSRRGARRCARLPCPSRQRGDDRRQSRTAHNYICPITTAAPQSSATEAVVHSTMCKREEHRDHRVRLREGHRGYERREGSIASQAAPEHGQAVPGGDA